MLKTEIKRQEFILDTLLCDTLLQFIYFMFDAAKLASYRYSVCRIKAPSRLDADAGGGA